MLDHLTHAADRLWALQWLCEGVESLIAQQYSVRGVFDQFFGLA